MRCEEARPLISAGLDEELEGNRAARLRAHLAECVVCSTERESLAATVQLVRGLPEAEPPAELRRRIGVALLEVERAPEGRWAGLAWLRRPRAPAWAWGAALGAAVAIIAVIAPRPQAPGGRLDNGSNRPPAAGSHLSVLAQAGTGARPGQRPAAPLQKLTAPGSRRALPALTARLALPLPAVDPQEPTLPVQASHPAVMPPPRRQRLVHSHPLQRLVVIHHGSAAVPIARAAPLPGSSPAERRAHSADDSARLARTMPPVSTDPAASPPGDSDSHPDTVGMTQMASGGAMPAPQEPADDDLAQLRHRLNDRPLQIPELGQLKPASSSHAKQDGWIRF